MGNIFWTLVNGLFIFWTCSSSTMLPTGMGQIRAGGAWTPTSAWQRTIALSCKAGARLRTRRVLDKTKRVVGSMVELEHVQNMNRPLTSVQNMFSIRPKRYGMNVQILVYHCCKDLAQNRFIFMAPSNIKLKICIFLHIFRPGFDPYSIL